MDISQFPFYSYDKYIDRLMEPLSQKVNIQFIAFRRCFSPLTQTFIIHSAYRDAMVDYYKKGYYKAVYLAKDIEDYESGFHMWDHFTNGAYIKAYDFLREQHQLYHGLSIVKQHGVYCDFFLFATHDRHSNINNFYLNHKELLLDFTDRFCEVLKDIIYEVSHCKVALPKNEIVLNDKSDHFSPRQLQCGRLLVKGLTSKEIAKELKLSPRTVEDYISILKTKFKAKNRAQLVYSLSGSLILENSSNEDC